MAYRPISLITIIAICFLMEPSIAGIEKPQQEYLTIVGVNIWVRSSPTDGKVVMKLNNGDRCKVLGRKRFEVIRGVGDYWYNIEFTGQKGWVFGSQTNKKMEGRYHLFNTLDELVNSTVFDSNEVEDWEGDPSVISEVGMSIVGEFDEGELCVVSFDSPGFMTGRNFSLIGFVDGDFWKCWEFPGEQVTLYEKTGLWFLIMYVKSTGGAYTLKNDYILYVIDPIGQTVQVKQNIFSFAEGLEEVVSGKASLSFTDEANKNFEIVETITHNYEEGRKGTFTYVFEFNSLTNQYLLVE